MTINLDAETVALAWSAAEVDVSVGTSADSGPLQEDNTDTATFTEFTLDVKF